jgi:hypothetical protein
MRWLPTFVIGSVTGRVRATFRARRGAGSRAARWGASTTVSVTGFVTRSSAGAREPPGFAGEQRIDGRGRLADMATGLGTVAGAHSAVRTRRTATAESAANTAPAMNNAV